MDTRRDDELGGNWQATHLRVQPHPGVPGADTAVLVHREGTLARDSGVGGRAVLYVHGYLDYFFHPHLAEAWEAAGWTFYALDLRGNGRAWDGTGELSYCSDLHAFGEELQRAIYLIRRAGAREVIINAHSTGGLLACVWTHAYPGAVDGLVLNSPWLDLAGPRLLRAGARMTARALARVSRRNLIGHLPGAYAHALHPDGGGEFHFRPDWKPLGSHPMRAGFVAAVTRAQEAVARGLELEVPVLVCHSEKSRLGLHRLGHCPGDADVVLDVSTMAAAASGLGEDVEIVPITGAVHDIALSAPPVRQRYFALITEWAARKVG